MKPYLPTLLLIVSFSILGLGAYLWRLTGNRSLMMNSLFGSFSMMYAAYEAVARNRPEWALLLPFFVTMLFGGRGIGTWWRSRKEAELQRPAEVMLTVAGLSLVATAGACFGQ